jgi:hypothetical protein
VVLLKSSLAAEADCSVATLSTPIVTTRPKQANRAYPFRVNWRKRRALRWLKIGLYIFVFFKAAAKVVKNFEFSEV